MATYTSKSKVENYLSINIDTSFDSQVTDWITAAEDYIDFITQKTFGTTTEDRYFDGNNERELDVDNFTAVNTVDVLEIDSLDSEYSLTEGKDNDFFTFPYNESPKYRLILSINAEVGSWLPGKKRIKVNADWGHSTSVPKDIELAATMLVAGMVEKGLKGGSVSSESLGDYDVTYKKVDDISSVMGVKDILNKYKVLEL